MLGQMLKLRPNDAHMTECNAAIIVELSAL